MTEDNKVMAPPFFKRGKGPLVSMLTATRGRQESLMECVGSCIDNLYSHDSIEFIFKVDEDDIDTQKAVDYLHKELPWLFMRMVVSPRGRGYMDMQRYLDEMASAASGDWLFLYTDDARITTKNWDLYLYNLALIQTPWPGIQDVCVLIAQALENPTGLGFPIMRRGLFELLGRMSPITYADGWIDTLMSVVGIGSRVLIEVDGDDPAKMEDVVPRPRYVRMSQPTSLAREMIKDATKIIDYIDEKDRARVWKEKPSEGHFWHWYRKDGRDVEELVLVSGDVGNVLDNNALVRLFNINHEKGLWSPITL